jgi:hypothetical protein
VTTKMRQQFARVGRVEKVPSKVDRAGEMSRKVPRKVPRKVAGARKVSVRKY